MADGEIEIFKLAERVLASELKSLPPRERGVVERAARRETVTRPAHRHFEQSLTFGQQLADRVAAVGGSWGFIAVFALLLVAWAVTNSMVLAQPLDPLPLYISESALDAGGDPGADHHNKPKSAGGTRPAAGAAGL